MTTPDSDVAHTLQALLDRQAIQDLVATYSRAVDRKDWALLRSLYTGDGIDDHGALYSGPADGFVAWLEGASAHLDAMSHQVHNMLVSIDGDAASGEAYVTAYNRWPDGEGGFDEFIQGLRYLDRYRREAGRWRFAHRTVTVDWAKKRKAFWDFDDPLLKGKRAGRNGATDPSYAILPGRCFARGGPESDATA